MPQSFTNFIVRSLGSIGQTFTTFFPKQDCQVVLKKNKKIKNTNANAKEPRNQKCKYKEPVSTNGNNFTHCNRRSMEYYGLDINVDYMIMLKLVANNFSYNKI